QGRCRPGKGRPPGPEPGQGLSRGDSNTISEIMFFIGGLLMRTLAMILVAFVCLSLIVGCSDSARAPEGAAAKSGGGGFMSNPGMLPTGASKTEPPVPAVTAEAPAADSKPMTAEAVAGVERSPRPKQDKAPQSGLLTAGSFDDNLNPNLFRSFVSQ